MTLISPTALWLLAACVLPALIHIANRRRHRTILWAATRFLIDPARPSGGGERLVRRIAILACRTLAIVALAIAAARPVSSALFGWEDRRPDAVVLLLDRSPSMEAKTRSGETTCRQLAMETIRDELAVLGPPELIMIDSASETPHRITPPELPTDPATSPTDADADIAALLIRAAENIPPSSTRPEIWIAADFQATSWSLGEERWGNVRATLAGLPVRPRVRVIHPAPPRLENRSIRVLSSQRENGRLKLDFEITGAPRSIGKIPLAIHWNGTDATKETIVSGSPARVTDFLPLPADSTSGYGWITLPADGNERDNRSFFAYGPARPLSSLVIAAPGETASTLARAVTYPPENSTADVVSPAAFPSENLQSHAAIFWAAPVPVGDSGTKLLDYLSHGGQIVFFPPGTATTDTFSDLGWSPPEDSPAGAEFRVIDWERDQGILRDAAEKTPLPLADLRAIRRQQPAGNSAPAARWSDGRPFVTRRISDHGSSWYVSTRPEYAWSDLPDGGVLVPLIRRIIREGGERFDRSLLATVGEGGPLAARISAAVPLAAETKDPAWQAGVSREKDTFLALNRPTSEDDPEVITPSVISGLLAGIPLGFHPLDESFPRAAPADLHAVFLVAALILLATEALLSFLTPRRPRATATESLRLLAAAACVLAVFRPAWHGVAIPAIIALLVVFWILRKRAGDF